MQSSFFYFVGKYLMVCLLSCCRRWGELCGGERFGWGRRGGGDRVSVFPFYSTHAENKTAPNLFPNLVSNSKGAGSPCERVGSVPGSVPGRGREPETVTAPAEMSRGAGATSWGRGCGPVLWVASAPTPLRGDREVAWAAYVEATRNDNDIVSNTRHLILLRH